MVADEHQRSIFRYPVRIVLTLALLGLGCWSVAYTWPQRLIRYDLYQFDPTEEERLQHYSNAQYAYGMNAWLNMQPEKAAAFFHQAAALDSLNFDAWCKLAEIEMELGNAEKAKQILTFASDRTDKIFRWKWPQLVLADALGLDSVFLSHVHYLLGRDLLVQDTFQLLHTQMGKDALVVIDVLDPSHLSAYLDWLMRWGMPEESTQVWEAMIATGKPDKETALRYAHFLLDHKRTVPSKEIWTEFSGDARLTNAGFEDEVTGRGFDWRYRRDKQDQWSMKRVSYQPHTGDFSLKVTFHGKSNLDFAHVYQIFAVSPQKRYRLSYYCKARGLTTDQGPFIEVFGFDQKGLYIAGEMITGSRGWHEKVIVFKTPADCHAAVMRLRRRASMRFDSKIRGMIWLDSFRLEEIANS